jgi:hypothetical protein
MALLKTRFSGSNINPGKTMSEKRHCGGISSIFIVIVFSPESASAGISNMAESPLELHNAILPPWEEKDLLITSSLS